MFLVNLYGNYNVVVGAIEKAFFGSNTVALVHDETTIAEIRRWEIGHVVDVHVYSDGSLVSNLLRIGYEGSRFAIKLDRSKYIISYQAPGWQPVYFSGTLQECADWYNNNDYVTYF